MELFIIIGGCYAIYRVGIAIATNIDYYSTEKEAKLVKRGKHRQYDSQITGTLARCFIATIDYHQYITNTEVL